MSADKKWGIARDTDSINGDVVGDIDVVGTVQNQGALNQANERAMIKCGPPSHCAHGRSDFFHSLQSIMKVQQLRDVMHVPVDDIGGGGGPPTGPGHLPRADLEVYWPQLSQLLQYYCLPSPVADLVIILIIAHQPAAAVKAADGKFRYHMSRHT